MNSRVSSRVSSVVTRDDGVVGQRSGAPRSLCAALIVGALALTACSGSDGDDGIDEQPVIDVGEAGIGTCLSFGDEIGAEVSELPVVDCNLAHTHEIFEVVINGDDLYPGFDALEESALTACLGAFEDYVGVSPFDSSLLYSWLVPTLDSWNREGDRETICVVGAGNGSPLTTSLRGSGL